MRKLVKKAVLVNEVLELVLVGAGIILLFLLLWKLLTPKMDPDAEAAKSFFKMLKQGVENADSGVTGEFMMWQNKNLYLVYFGNNMVFPYAPLTQTSHLTQPTALIKILFLLKNRYRNYICVCYKTSKKIKWGNEDYDATICNPSFCTTLNSPAVLSSGTDKEGRWLVGTGPRLGIHKIKDKYIFSPLAWTGCSISAGEIEVAKGVCICDVSNGWVSATNPGNPEPTPCVSAGRLESFPFDKSVTEGDPNTKGICIEYPNLRYWGAMRIAVAQKSKGYDASLLEEYNKLKEKYTENPGGYFEKAERVVRLRGEGGAMTDEYIVTRNYCLESTKSNRKYYAIFYDKWIDNMDEGYEDDTGFCVAFNQNDKENIVLNDKDEKASIPTRKWCRTVSESDPSYKYSFFMNTKGTQKTEVQRAISTHYSIDINSEEFGKDFNQEDVKKECYGWEYYSLVFIKGMKKTDGTFDASQAELSCNNEIKWLQNNNKIEGDFAVEDTAKIDDEKVCCYASSKIISTHYSLDIYAKEFGDEKTRDEVETKCNRWSEFDLTFIKGMKIKEGKYDISQVTGACQREMNWLKANRNLKLTYVVRDKENIDDKNICCYMKKAG